MRGVVIALSPIGVFVAVKLMLGREPFPPTWVYAVAILNAIVICLLRVRWGDSISIEGGAIILMRNGQVALKIDESQLRSVKMRKQHLLSLEYMPKGTDQKLTLMTLITKEGFSDEIWERLCASVQARVSSQFLEN